MRALTFIGCCYAAALWIAASLFGLSDDVLFFHSDLLSKSYFLAALGFLFLPATLLVVGALAASGRRHGVLRIAGAVPLALLIGGFMVAGGELAFGKVQAFAHYAMLMAGAIALAAVLIWRLPNRGVVLERAGQLSRLVLLVAVPCTLAAGAYFHLAPAAAASGPPRHAVMVLVDGLPSQLLARYAPDAAPTELDKVADRGCVVARAYTSRTYTSGYFSVFYTGDYSGAARRADAVLPQALERAGQASAGSPFTRTDFPNPRVSPAIAACARPCSASAGCGCRACSASTTTCS